MLTQGEGQRGVVGLGDGGHDGQAQAEPLISGGPAARDALAAGQREQRLDQLFLLLAYCQHAFAGAAQGLSAGVGVGQGDLDHRAFQRERGAQFVGGVGDEGALGVEGSLQPGQQAVDGIGQVRELVAGSRHGQPPVQVVLGDLAGGRGDRPQRPQDPPGH